MLNTAMQPFALQQYQEEYLQHLAKYANINATSQLIAYYNININESSVDPDTKASFDRYHTSGIKFDLYDFTPAFYVTPLSNTPIESPDTIGNIFDSILTVSIFTIRYPRINDLIVFYNPAKRAKEIFRVNNFRTVLEFPKQPYKNLYWYEVYGEYAPIKDVSEINVVNRYVYDFMLESYLPYNVYQEKMKTLGDMDKLINEEIAPRFNYNSDYYIVDDKIPVEMNLLLATLARQFNNNYNRIFSNLYVPYGFFHLIDEPDDISVDLTSPEFDTDSHRTYHYITKTDDTPIEYEYTPDADFSANNLLSFTNSTLQLVKHYRHLQLLNDQIIQQ